MRLRRPYVARLDQVDIKRRGDSVEFTYREPGVGGVSLKLGRDTKGLTDAELLEALNDTLRAMEAARASYVHVAREIPDGRPQLEFHALSATWVSRGEVLRCVLEGGDDDGPTVYVDDVELSWADFGRTLTVWAGWGMRIVIVPDDQLTVEPTIEVREPEE